MAFRPGEQLGAPTPSPFGVGGMPPAGMATNFMNGVMATVPGAASEPIVFLGWSRESTRPSPGPGMAAAFRDLDQGFRKSPKEAPISALLAEFDGWNIKRKKDIARALARAGFIPGIYKGESLDEFLGRQDLGSVRAAYGNLLQEAADRYAMTGAKITPGQLLNQYIQYNESGKNGGLFGPGGDGTGDGSPYANKTITQTSTSRNVDIMDPMDARGLVRATLRRELDRDPTEGEFEDFVATLMHAQKTHPSVTRTRTTTVYDENGMPVDNNSSSTTRGGLTGAGIEELLTREAQSQPGWAEWQAIGTYFPALLQALGSAVPGT